MEEITFDDLIKIDIRVGEIVAADEVEGSEKLIKMLVDFGELGEKIVMSGIRKCYQTEEIVGKKAAFVINLPVKEIMGQKSEAMILTAGNDENFSIITLDREMENGARIY